MDLPPTTSRGACSDRSGLVRLLMVLDNNFSSRVNTMLHDVFEDSDRSESEDIDDSDANPDFALPNDELHEDEDAVNTPEIESEDIDNNDADPDFVSEESDWWGGGGRQRENKKT